MKRIAFDPARCAFCGACMMACSLIKTGRIDPSLSRIRIETAGSTHPLRAAVCTHCEEPACVTACMRGIIDKNETSGLVTRRFEDCFRCAACLVSCPVGAVVEDETRKAFVACDLCLPDREDGRDPLCVRICPGGALRFEEESEASVLARNRYAISMFTEKPQEAQDPDDGQWEAISRMLAEEIGLLADAGDLKAHRDALRKAAEEGM